MHWGDSTDAGSEHLLNGKPYAAEVIGSIVFQILFLF